MIGTLESSTEDWTHASADLRLQRTRMPGYDAVHLGRGVGGQAVNTHEGGADAPSMPGPRGVMPSRRQLFWLAVGAAAFVLLLVLAAAPSIFGAWRPAQDARAALLSAEQLAQHGRADEAVVSLNKAKENADIAVQRLNSVAPKILGALPYIGRPVRAARILMEAIGHASDAATELIPLVRDGGSIWKAGIVDVPRLDSMRESVQAGQRGFAEALATARKAPSSPLPGFVASQREVLLEKLESAERGMNRAELGLALSSKLFGASGTRRYLLMFENPAEMRGVGGFWGNYGILTADQGRLTLERFGRTTRDLQGFANRGSPEWFRRDYGAHGADIDWRQLPSAPDFRTVASIAEANLNAAEGFGPLDGTIAADPAGLAALLRITGPVSVPSWPAKLDASNLVRVTMHDAHSYFTTDDQRVDFLSDTANTVWSSLLSADVKAEAIGRSGLGTAVSERHLRLHFSRPEEQRLSVALGADGRLGDPKRTIGVVTQNLSGHKMDYWLHRQLRGSIRVAGDGVTSVSLAVTLVNRGPASGEPQYVIGPNAEGERQGWNHQLLRLYFPRGAAVLADDLTGELSIEQGFVVFSRRVLIPPGESERVRVRAWIPAATQRPEKRASLVLRRQPVLHPDRISFEVKAPFGWSLALPKIEGVTGGSTVQGSVASDVRILEAHPGLIGRLLGLFS